MATFFHGRIKKRLVLCSLCFHFHFQILETLAQGVEQRLTLVGFGSDFERIGSFSFHAEYIATIVDGDRC